MYYKLSRLLLVPTSGKLTTSAEVFISNPQIDQEALLGKLFFICEIDSNKPAALKIINFFISTLPTHYYHGNKISLKEKMSRIEISDTFEKSLAKVNADFEKFLKTEKIKIESKKINLAAGVVFNNELTFASVGNVKALLIHSEKDDSAAGKNSADDESIKTISKKIYKITPITEHETSAKKINMAKIFSHIITGKIPPEGYLIFTNEIFPEYISNKHLSKIITTLPPTSAVEHLKTQLHKINSYVTFTALIIKNSLTPQVARSIPRMELNVNAKNSLETMKATERDTEKYLSPFGSLKNLNIFSFIKKLIPFVQTSQQRIMNEAGRTAIRDKIFLTRKSPLRLLYKISYHLKNIFYFFINIIIYFLKILFHPKELIFKINNFFKKLYYLIFRAIQWYKGLPVMSKIWLLVFVIGVSFFSYSLLNITSSQTQSLFEANYQDKWQLIKQKQNQIDAALLYGDETRAKELIDESNVLIEELRSFKNIEEKLVDSLAGKSNEQLEKISHVIETTPTELVNFSRLEKNAQVTSIALLDQLIVATDPNTGTLYQFSLTDNTASILALANNLNFAANSDNAEAVFIGSGGGVIADKSGIRSTIDNVIAESLSDIADIAYYNSRLYVLAPNDNNVLRFARNFNSSEEWIKEDIDVSNGVSVAIDGYIYVLKNNGELIKLLSGYTNKFELAEINPPLTQPAKIRLTGDSENGRIYILEPNNHRIVLFSKEGKFITQYKFSALNNVYDFIVVEPKAKEDKTKIILLQGSLLYEIEIPKN